MLTDFDRHFEGVAVDIMEPAMIEISDADEEVAAIDAKLGGLEATPEEASILQTFAARAERVVLGADSSKLQATAPVVGLAWEQVDVLVTELAPHHERLSSLRERSTLFELV